MEAWPEKKEKEAIEPGCRCVAIPRQAIVCGWGNCVAYETQPQQSWSEGAAHAALRTGCGFPARGVVAAGAVCPLQARVPHFGTTFHKKFQNFAPQFHSNALFRAAGVRSLANSCFLVSVCWISLQRVSGRPATFHFLVPLDNQSLVIFVIL